MKTRTYILTALALCLSAGVAQAQNHTQPWQGTFSATGVVHDTQMVVDIPAPLGNRVLTIEQISIVLGPTASIYGKLLRCEIASSHPRPPVLVPSKSGVVVEDVNRIHLPPVTWLAQGSKTWLLPHTPIRLHYEGSQNSFLRVTCEVDAIANGDKLAVTLVGYTSQK